jgi:hypothetical protein
MIGGPVETDRKHGGFTLVETLAALAATALLMSAILSLVAGLARDGLRIQTSAGGVGHELEPIVELLRWDLSHARHIRQDANGRWLELVGYGGIDPVERSPSGRHALVTYKIVRQDRADMLVREQRYLDDPREARPWRELILRHVQRVHVQRIFKPNEQARSRPGEVDFLEKSDVPRFLRVIIDSQRQGASVDRALVLH